ncbi:hypothetical protein [Haladaptatus sp. T7]|uniref:hypothetical protein n=1 Tax=Haladaptatus sp. T7 TaxID=2029368 RepID=UPI0021A25A7D|nr:hypothetical protein [Haladaptatus sp. T7]GKZ14888.1 hypothetical protein HAL_27690 [Haladaptatus sp. T7]
MGATISTGVVGLSGISIARPIGPDDPKAHSTHQTRDLGSHYYYDERIVDTGSRVEFVDSTFLAGKWNFVYRTSAATYSIDHKPSTDESKKAGVITGGEGFTIKELDNPRQVSTSISGNADWGLGVKSPNNYNNNWSNAAKNTITALISYFSPAVGAIATAAQIVNYWKEAAKPTGSHADVVGNYWNFWDPSGAKTDSLGHYVEYTHKVPPREEYGKDYFDSTIRNSQNNNMNQIDNYVKTFGLSMYINSSPNNMSTSEQKKYGVEKVPAAKSRAAMLSDQELDPDEPVYIARNPTVKIEEL